MSGYITERDMLEVMETGKAFSLKCVSYDRKRNTGGKVKQYKEAILVQATKEAKANARRNLTPKELRALDERNTPRTKPKNPHHQRFYTRNIRILQDGHPTQLQRKIHPPLVIEFNGKRVVP
jgi:hypothetical protein